ncbi:uncharacterized protein L969DRAFT_93827 [Mixia osmundae IAM 14324]|uniref:Cysteine-rich PDZ-binding protein n=1 Tax=Mixia osmundae (strain CBS 9802 / IAM 14324 / JCM 22182 / KY 12970) TaxID=764103 RepID=G7E9P7_MIXOS|nr:uncharacterized protein L969DRAFT_93827 [Mixia osmundae IAM 14324]KEI39997.1 hypothetical protein L969DRAFT_93827 [Mixia osmundae IAM 14324]GAA99366.1 hypothetical protein E5Q_06062 [Mixia osmundae IAM 14324]
MVCAKCDAKLRKGPQLAAPDPFKSKAENSAGRKIGENKLLSSKRYSPYAPVAGSSKGSGAAMVSRCTTCRSQTSRPGAKYCQQCAQKAGKCALCGAAMMDTRGYKMSSK